MHLLGCGGLFTEDKGIIMVDKTVGDLSATRHVCQWTIKAPFGQKVVLTIKYLGFATLSPLADEQCSYDKINVESKDGLHVSCILFMNAPKAIDWGLILD